MGGFALPSLPSGILSLIDTSPPVFYPSKKKDRPRSNSQSTTCSERIQLSQSQTYLGISNASLPASPSSSSVICEGDEWEPLPRRIGRRQSIGELGNLSPLRQTPTRPSHRRSQSALPPGLIQFSHSGNASTSRPAPLAAGYHPSPTSRLQEFWRNRLASTSAISLPTLAEMEHHDPADADVDRPIPVSPIYRPRNRPNSRSSMVEPLSPTPFSNSSLPPPESPRRLTLPHHRRSYSSSVPPPQPLNLAAGDGKARTNLHPPRPPASPRSWSDPSNSLPTIVNQAISIHKNSIVSTSSSVSDVAVLATWSFPNSPERKDEESEVAAESRGRDPVPRGEGVMQPSNRLRDRLRSLSMLDTSLEADSSSNSASGSLTSSPSIPIPTNDKISQLGHMPRRSLQGVIHPSHPFPWKSSLPVSTTHKTPSHLHHRHTHSSPNLVHLQKPGGSHDEARFAVPSIPPSTLNPLLPPPRPQRRPTTSRLRQPTLLSMPQEPSGTNIPSSTNQWPPTSTTSNRLSNTNRLSSTSSLAASLFNGSASGDLSSSPGSMISDDSIQIYPSPAASFESLPRQDQIQIGDDHDSIVSGYKRMVGPKIVLDDDDGSEVEQTDNSKWYKPGRLSWFGGLAVGDQGENRTRISRRRASIAGGSMTPPREDVVGEASVQSGRMIDLALSRSQSHDVGSKFDRYSNMSGGDRYSDWEAGLSIGGGEEVEETFKDFDDI